MESLNQQAIYSGKTIFFVTTNPGPIRQLAYLARKEHLKDDPGVLPLRMFWLKKIEKVPKVTLYAYLFKPNPPNSAK